MDLKSQLLAERLGAYARLRGGFPIVLAGMVFWLAMAAGWAVMEPIRLLQAAFGGSGLIFPLALGLAWAFGIPFLKDRTAVSPVLVPAFVSMLLFWPMVFIAVAEASAGVVLCLLAIGLSIHWPVIGWSYGRAAPFCAHAIVRAGLVFAIFYAFPDQRFTLIPLAVAAVYGASALFVWADSGRVARRLGIAAPGIKAALPAAA
jgi:hypothetical protein